MKLKKKRGTIDKFGIPMFTMVMVFAMMVMYMTYTNDMDKKDKIDIISREYLLKMETEGFLNTTDETEFLKELTKSGMENISIIGTTRSDVGYGNKINLNVVGQVKITNYKIEDIFKITNTPTPINIKITKSSTAKR